MTRHPWLIPCAAALTLVASSAPVVQGTVRVPADPRAVTHALNRLAFGPQPGDIERLTETGLAAWIEGQLQPARIDDRALATRLARLTTIGLAPATLATEYIQPARAARRALQQQSGQASPRAQPGDASTAPRPDEAEPGMATGQPRRSTPDLQRGRRVVAELSEAKLLRAVYSERQLEEVLVDFWFNHFNVFARKGPVEIYVGAYERDTIRPHVLGRFRDLLGATAKSPAMLLYLDNWQSVDPQAGARLAARGARRAASPVTAPLARGLNENYARELLELHTLGVDGGYTQQDVVAVARAFTGWTIQRPRAGGEFRFVPMLHDRAAKTILGRTLPAGGGIEDGERVLDLLAAHPSTARHIAFKLAQRFVADAPPPPLVDRAAAVFRDTDGDLRRVVRSIVLSDEFFADTAYRAKIKTPFEYVASALRATGADVQHAPALVRALATLGMPLYLCQPPTGYDETAEAWVSSGSLVNRLNVAVALTSGALRGVRVATDRSADAARTRIVADALGGEVSAATAATLSRAATAAQATALVIGSPEFQRQ
jgi:uncharacterized protein (DUF1800 family)